MISLKTKPWNLQHNFRCSKFLSLMCFFVFLLLGCSESVPNSPTKTPSVTAVDFEQRPLALPSLDPNQPCPRTAGHQISEQFGIALGNGPVYPVGLGLKGILQFEYPPPANTLFAGSAWGGNKVLWIVAPSYTGDVLIRGGRLDADELLRFDEGANPSTTLRIEASAPSKEPQWRERPSFTRIKDVGCYAYQVDGDGFSYTIIFEAQVTQ